MRRNMQSLLRKRQSWPRLLRRKIYKQLKQKSHIYLLFWKKVQKSFVSYLKKTQI